MGTLSTTGLEARPPGPRRWQINALARWEASGRRGIVEVVTGAGKTRFALMCCERFLAGGGTRIVVVVPTLSLVDQWYVAIQEEGNVGSDEIAVFTGETRSPEPRTYNLLTLNTARSLAKSIPVGHSTLLISDECHRAASAENRKALDGIYAATLGMSATPERQYDEGLIEVLIPTLGDVIFRYDYADARRDGVIAAFELVNVGVALTQAEDSKYQRYTRRIARFLRERGSHKDDPQLQALLRARSAVSARAAMRVPATVRLVDLNRNSRLLVFHEAIRSAEAIATALRSRGHSAATYHSALGPAVRRENLRLFRQGALDVLVTCRALDEGVNLPETTVAVIASSTASTRQRIQRLGRVLRPAPGKTRALIYTIYATSVEETRLAAEAANAIGAERVRWQRIETRG